MFSTPASSRRRSWLCQWVCLALLLATDLSAQKPEPGTTLRKVGDIRRLSREAAAQAFPVRIQGVCTHFEAGRKRFFVQDDTGGVYVLLEREHEPPGLVSGSLVEVLGVTASGRFAPNVRGAADSSAEVRVLGAGAWPLPVRLGAEQLLRPSHHCQWVQFTCVLHSGFEEFGHLRFRGSAYGQKFELVLSARPMPKIDDLLFRVLTVSGVYVALYDEASRQVGFELYAPRTQNLVRMAKDRNGIFGAPVRKSDELLRYTGDGAQVVRMQGVVTLAVPGEGFFLRDERGSVWVTSVQEGERLAGQSVEIAGRPAQGRHRPYLSDASVRPMEKKLPPPEPLRLAASHAARAGFDGELVTLEGRVLDIYQSEGRSVLLLEASGQTFTAEQTRATTVPKVPLQSLVAATGILRVPSARDSGAEPGSFHLMLDGPDAVTVRRRPPWWDAPWVRWALGGLLLLGTAALAWNVALHRRVARQTALIERKVESERVAAERERIAQDLHDSLQQELAGLGLQIQSAENALPPGLPHAAEALALARTTLRHTQAEVRRTVWDLGPAELACSALGDAMRGRLASIPAKGSAQVAFATNGEPRRLPRLVELSLLRIAQEAVGNALQHACAAQVQVALEYDALGVRLTVRDDGAGFDPAACLAGPPAHSFGLRSMRRRARHIGADFECSSAPGAGTTITTSWCDPTPASIS